MNSYIDMNELKRRATHQGWKVELRNGGHVGWTSPAGKLIIAPSTRSDSRGIMDQIKLMEKHGFINEPNKIKGRSGRTGRVIADFLKENPNVFFDADTIAQKTGLNNSQVSSSLKALREHHTGFYMKREKNKFFYYYTPEPIQILESETNQVSVSTPKVEEVFHELQRMREIQASRELPELSQEESTSEVPEQNPEEKTIEQETPQLEKSTEIVLASSNLPKKTPLLFEPISTYPKGGLILRDEDGMIWLVRKMIPES